MSVNVSIYHISGRVSRFNQADEAIAQDWLTKLQPNRLFEDPLLVVGDGRSISMFRSRNISRIDLVTTPPNQLQMVERVQHSHMLAAPPLGTLADQRVHVRYDLADGDNLYIAYDNLEQRPPAERYTAIHQHLQLPVVEVQHPDGGVVLINPAHILRVVIQAHGIELPHGAWRANER
ncbi:hypothetical protein ABWL39_03900 [Chitinivorax sp. PXF-14]|uniref:hypothetical protein n=1 Tax=Chitinivorax sp. PXF-14 TaxID=3230488 RepID=UPI0034666ADC